MQAAASHLDAHALPDSDAFELVFYDLALLFGFVELAVSLICLCLPFELIGFFTYITEQVRHEMLLYLSILRY